MAKTILNQILNQLVSLEMEELQQLQQTIKNHIVQKEITDKQAAFHQALINSGLVKKIKPPAHDLIAERRLIQVKGKPVSETIIEERR